MVIGALSVNCLEPTLMDKESVSCVIEKIERSGIRLAIDEVANKPRTFDYTASEIYLEFENVRLDGNDGVSLG